LGAGLSNDLLLCAKNAVLNMIRDEFSDCSARLLIVVVAATLSFEESAMTVLQKVAAANSVLMREFAILVEATMLSGSVVTDLL